MFMRPLAVLVSSMDMLGQSIPGMRRLDGIVGRIVHTLSRPPNNQPRPKSDVASNAENNAGEEYVQVTISKARNNPRGKQMNENASNDECLNDDLLKLVRYKVLFVKRDYEVAFPEQEELVYDNLTPAAYTAWKVAEFIQGLGRTKVPKQWHGGTDRAHRPGYPGDAEFREGSWMINRLPEADKKYWRVYFKVLDRYVREELQYEQRQLDALKDIAKAIRRERSKPRPEPWPAGSEAEPLEVQPIQVEATEAESAKRKPGRSARAKRRPARSR